MNTYYNNNRYLENGPVKKLPPGIAGIKMGDGFIVIARNSRNERVEINSYADAMKMYTDFLEQKNEKAITWLILASNMPGSEIEPISIPKGNYMGCC